MRSLEEASGSVEPSSPNEDAPLPPRLPPRRRGPPRAVRRVLRFGMLAIAGGSNLLKVEWHKRTVEARARARGRLREVPSSASMQFIGRSASKTVTTPSPKALHTAHPTNTTRDHLRSTLTQHTNSTNFPEVTRAVKNHVRGVEPRSVSTTFCQALAQQRLTSFNRSRMWRVLRNTKQMCADRVCASIHFPH